MAEFTFTLILDAEPTGEQLDALSEAGFGDGALDNSNGMARVLFTREAPTLTAAIRATTEAIHRVPGLRVERVARQPRAVR